MNQAATAMFPSDPIIVQLWLPRAQSWTSYNFLIRGKWQVWCHTYLVKKGMGLAVDAIPTLFVPLYITFWDVSP